MLPLVEGTAFKLKRSPPDAQLKILSPNASTFPGWKELSQASTVNVQTVPPLIVPVPWYCALGTLVTTRNSEVVPLKFRFRALKCTSRSPWRVPFDRYFALNPKVTGPEADGLARSEPAGAVTVPPPVAN